MLPLERMHIQRPAAFPQLEWIIGPPSPYRSARHFHEDLEIALNLGRTWQQVYRGQTYTVPGDALLLTPPGESHTAYSLESGAAPYVGLRIAPAALCEALTEMTERPQPLPFFREVLVTDPGMHAHVLAFHAALPGAHLSRLTLDALWQQVVADLQRLSTTHAALPPARREPGAIRIVKAYLHEQYRVNVALRDLAQLAGMSTFALSRSFRATVGIAPHAYQTQIRVLHAQRLLRQGYPPGEVALLTGFHNQSHLGRHFKRLVGLTPGQYAHDCRPA